MNCEFCNNDVKVPCPDKEYASTMCWRFSLVEIPPVMMIEGSTDYIIIEPSAFDPATNARILKENGSSTT